jgi:hypothetical protein
MRAWRSGSLVGACEAVVDRPPAVADGVAARVVATGGGRRQRRGAVRGCLHRFPDISASRSRAISSTDGCRRSSPVRWPIMRPTRSAVLETSRGMRTARLREGRSGSVPALTPIPGIGSGNEIHSVVHTGVLRRPGSVWVRSGRGPPTSARRSVCSLAVQAPRGPKRDRRSCRRSQPERPSRTARPSR